MLSVPVVRYVFYGLDGGEVEAACTPPATARQAQVESSLRLDLRPPAALLRQHLLYVLTLLRILGVQGEYAAGYTRRGSDDEETHAMQLACICGRVLGTWIWVSYLRASTRKTLFASGSVALMALYHYDCSNTPSE